MQTHRHIHTFCRQDQFLETKCVPACGQCVVYKHAIKEIKVGCFAGFYTIVWWPWVHMYRATCILCLKVEIETGFWTVALHSKYGVILSKHK